MDAASGFAGILWGIGIAALFLAVIPLLLFIAHRLFGLVREIKHYAEDIEPHATAIVENLSQASALQDTRDATRRLRGHLTDYANALDRIL